MMVCKTNQILLQGVWLLAQIEKSIKQPLFLLFSSTTFIFAKE